MHLITYLILTDEIATAPPVRIYRAVSKLDFPVNQMLTEFGTQERIAFICTDSPLPKFVALSRDQLPNINNANGTSVLDQYLKNVWKQWGWSREVTTH
jgi:hypothetical protein